MDPILASGLVGAGTTLLRSIFGPKPPKPPKPLNRLAVRGGPGRHPLTPPQPKPPAPPGLGHHLLDAAIGGLGGVALQGLTAPAGITGSSFLGQSGSSPIGVGTPLQMDPALEVASRGAVLRPPAFIQEGTSLPPLSPPAPLPFTPLPPVPRRVTPLPPVPHHAPLWGGFAVPMPPASRLRPPGINPDLLDFDPYGPRYDARFPTGSGVVR